MATSQPSISTSQIKPIDKTSIHRITSGQVVVDLQTAVKELVENSVDAGATNIEVRFKQYGLKSIEVIDNGSGISEEDFESIALKHHTSKLETFEDLTTVRTFGFRGEALSSLCALCDQVCVTTATRETDPKGTCLEMSTAGQVKSRQVVARRRGTTVALAKLFSPLPVRRKELERNAKREFGKALSLLQAYALGPCACGDGVRLTVSNQPEKGQKSVQIQTHGTPSVRASVTVLWGPKALENIVALDLSFAVDTDKSAIKRFQKINQELPESVQVQVKGLTSKFDVGCGRLNTDRQFFYINGRPCNLSKVQKAFNEVYRTFNANQSPFIVADFLIPTDSCDVNVSPDKRTIFIHNEENLISSLKAALESRFLPSRSTFNLSSSQGKHLTQTSLAPSFKRKRISTSIESDDTRVGNNVSSTVLSLGCDIQGATLPTPGPSNDILESDTEGDFATPTHLDRRSQRSESPGEHRETPMDVDRRLLASPSPQPTTASPSHNEPSSKGTSDIVLDTKKASWAHLTTPSRDLYSSDDDEHDARPRKRHRLGDSRDSLASETSELPQERASQSRSSSATDNRDHRTSIEARTSLRNQLLSVRAPSIQLHVPSKVATKRRREADENLSSEDDQENAKIAPSLQVPDPIPIPSHQPKDRLFNVSSAATHVGHTRVIDLPPEEEDGDDDEDPSSVLSSARTTISTTPSGTRDEPISHPEIIRRSDSSNDLSLKFDVDRIVNRWNRLRERCFELPCSGASVATEGAKVPAEASVANHENNAKAADALARVIDKEDFSSMVVIGQFNLGFIIVRRKQPLDDGKATMDDLFIVDQHAADEKYNFETLQLTTKIQSQKLLRPRILEFTAADEMLAAENLDILRSNGFEVEEVNPDACGSQGGLRLTAQPVSKSTVFSIQDLEELVHLLRSSPSGKMVRCSKARTMFAMRACRKSVMVGMPLNHSQMLTVVRHMGTMDQPWNCPHGRPTMRHLVDIAASGPKPSKGRRIDWSIFD